jgi:hypothetical protein
MLVRAGEIRLSPLVPKLLLNTCTKHEDSARQQCECVEPCPGINFGCNRHGASQTRNTQNQQND